MDNNKKLILLKSVHTVIWIVMNAAVFYCLWKVIIMEFDPLFFCCIFLILAECLLLLLNGLNCPLNNMAKKYTGDRRYGFDIYIPAVIAKYNIAIYSVIIAFGIIIYVINKVSG
jgi:hypothetical protein